MAALIAYDPALFGRARHPARDVYLVQRLRLLMSRTLSVLLFLLPILLVYSVYLIDTNRKSITNQLSKIKLDKVKYYSLLALTLLALVALRLLLLWDKLPLFLDVLIHVFLSICGLLFCFEFFKLAHFVCDCCYNWRRRRRLLQRLQRRQS